MHSGPGPSNPLEPEPGAHLSRQLPDVSAKFVPGVSLLSAVPVGAFVPFAARGEPAAGRGAVVRRAHVAETGAFVSPQAAVPFAASRPERFPRKAWDDAATAAAAHVRGEHRRVSAVPRARPVSGGGEYTAATADGREGQ